MFKRIDATQLPFWLLAFSLVIGLTVPVLIQDGMFMDAMLYTSVSHNLGHGIGTFWFPQFSLKNLSEMSSFHEQPPLVFGIQAMFFYLLGDSMYIERLYTFITMLVTAYLIFRLWKNACSEEQQRKIGWLPIIVWITIPVCFWSFANNMHENTMGIFVLASAIFTVKGLRSERFNPIQFFLAGLFVFLASLSKGIPGLFTLSLPFIYRITTRKVSFRNMFAASLIMVAVPTIIYGILFTIPSCKESLLMYFNRLSERVNNEPTVSSRFDIIGQLISQLIPQLAFCLVVVFLAGINRVKDVLRSDNNSMSVFFILAGFSGALPLMLTKVQKGFYLVPAMPFLAIGLSLFMAPLLIPVMARINVNSKAFKMFRVSMLVVLLFITIFSIAQVGKTSRDNDELHDVYVIGKIIPKYSAITVPANTWNSWSLQCYLMRYYNISLDPDTNREYFLIDRQIAANVPPGYKKLNLELVRYELYEKQ